MMDDRLREIEEHIKSAWEQYSPENSMAVFSDARWLIQQVRRYSEENARLREALTELLNAPWKQTEKTKPSLVIYTDDSVIENARAALEGK